MSATGDRYFVLNKPCGMVSQFKSSHDVVLLGDLNFPFPEGTHAIGRLDQDSEGLLLLTTNKSITKKLFQGDISHKRTYLVWVKDIVTTETLTRLQKGISFQVRGGGYYTSLPCEAIKGDPATYFQKDEGFNYGPSSWVQLTLTEGKFHQVRKMVRTVGHKCKRLIRVAIEDITLGTLKPGEVKEYTEAEFFRLLKLPLH